MQSWKEETPAEYINISHISFYLSPVDFQAAKGAAVPSQPRRLLERNSIASKVRVLPGKGTRPRATGRQEAERNPVRLPAAPISSCSTKVPCVFSIAVEGWGVQRAPPRPGVRAWPPHGWCSGQGKRCSVRQCAAAASCRRGWCPSAAVGRAVGWAQPLRAQAQPSSALVLEGWRVAVRGISESRAGHAGWGEDPWEAVQGLLQSPVR